MMAKQLLYPELPRNSDDSVVSDGPSQLSLFDFDPVVKLVFLPMRSIHGQAFKRSVLQLSPQMVVDLRMFPYFNLPTLDANLAFDLFSKNNLNYVHLPFELKPSVGIQRWAMRQSAGDFLSSVVEISNDGWGPFVFLINDEFEFQYLESLSRGMFSERNQWEFEFSASVT